MSGAASRSFGSKSLEDITSDLETLSRETIQSRGLAITRAFNTHLGNRYHLPPCLSIDKKTCLGKNSVSGNIPAELGDCSSLLWLDLNTNLLNGSIPPPLSKQSGYIVAILATYSHS
nr:systemin receptor SR160 [Ipomoea batatas]